MEEASTIRKRMPCGHGQRDRTHPGADRVRRMATRNAPIHVRATWRSSGSRETRFAKPYALSPLPVYSRSDRETGRNVREATPWVVGVVGWVDLTAPDDLADALNTFAGRGLVGVRQVHDEPDPRWLARSDVQRSLELVADAGLAIRTYRLELR